MSPWQPRPVAPGRSNGSPLLAANFLPVNYTADKFPAGMVPFSSPGQLAELREDLAGTHVVTRAGDQVVCVPVSADAAAVGRQTELDVRGDRRVAAHLVEAALIRQVLAPRYKLRSVKPIKFVNRTRDLMRDTARDLGIELAGVQVYPQYCLGARATGPTRGPGIVLGVKTRYEISLPVSELLRLKVPVLGRYVLVDPDELNPLIDPLAARRLAGSVEKVAAGRLILRDAPRDSEVLAAEAWLEGRREVVHDVVHALARPTAVKLLDRLDTAVFGLTGAEGRLSKTRELAVWFGRNQLELATGLAATVGQPVGIDGPDRVALRSRRIHAPAFEFSPGGGKASQSTTRGLDEYGPYDSESFTPKSPVIAVITPTAFKGTAETFTRNFLEGIPRSVFHMGFIRKYHLGACEVTFEAFDSSPDDVAAYRNACLAALGKEKKPHLAIVITSQEQEGLCGDDSPYLACKSVFMGQSVPVQDIQVETLLARDIAYPLDSIALACYAKLGGTPYVIAAAPSMTQELVIGIGSAHLRQAKLTTPERVVGITTVFSADGNYLLSNRSREVDYAAYPAELLRSLESCITYVRERNGWQPDDALRLIFHVFKPLKDIEARAVKDLAEKLAGEYAQVEFAFLHLSDEHDWMLFDQHSDGYKGRGQGVPGRGHAVELSRSEVLLSVTGPQDMKLQLQGLPKPLLLKLHRESNFTDLNYLAGQVFRFTYMSWRRAYPSRKPVTILYSDLIAELLGNLRQVRNWNADIVSSPGLRDKRWFL